jgi:hypothetical protein
MDVYDSYYDELLEEVLKHPKIQECIKDLKETDLTQYELESNAIDDFFNNEDYEVIFEIDEIYKALVDEVREEIDWITSSKDEFARNIDFKLEDFVIRKLER